MTSWATDARLATAGYVNFSICQKRSRRTGCFFAASSERA
jgi:hypothetical protein